MEAIEGKWEKGREGKAPKLEKTNSTHRADLGEGERGE